ncbi:hypothetical protein BY996DRAFT_1194529 [Phakopsora pachyrhizi]|nr:hypothetical protein BY996DRAFT_1194529 [Phakopsora pachyrhizi]
MCNISSEGSTNVQSKPKTTMAAAQGALSAPVPSTASLKRKRPQGDSSSATSWFGMAFQIPAVIKREFNDFIKTVRDGSPQTPDRLSRSKRHSIQSSKVSTERPNNHHSKFSSIKARSHPTRNTPNKLSSTQPLIYDSEVPSAKKFKVFCGVSETQQVDQSGEWCTEPLPAVSSVSSFGSLGLTLTRGLWLYALSLYLSSIIFELDH